MTYAHVRRWLEEHTSFEPSLLEGAGFESLVAQRIAAVGGGNESAYIEVLRGSPDECDRLAAGIAVPETWLFRYPRSYDLLVDVARRLLSSGATTLRMLSIGCATGQEPYCMAMAALHAGWPAECVSVTGLDRNREFLQTAAVGAYGPASLRGEIPDWAMPFLRRSSQGIVIDAALRSIVRFARADATDPTAIRGIGPCDVVFCRNVLIYLNSPARLRLLESICEALAPGGLLFVGHAEQLQRGVPRLRLVPAPHAFALERIDVAMPAETDGCAPARNPPASVPAATRRIDQFAARPPAAVPPPELPPAETLDAASDLADAGRTQDSETMIRSIIARRGPSARAFELLGLIRMAASDTPAARRCFEQAVYLDPGRATSLIQLALISEQAGEGRRAEVLWDRARRASVAAGQEQTP